MGALVTFGRPQGGRRLAFGPQSLRQGVLVPRTAGDEIHSGGLRWFRAPKEVEDGSKGLEIIENSLRILRILEVLRLWHSFRGTAA